MKIETMLHEEIEAKLEKLKHMDVGSDEYRNGAESVAKLLDRAIELDKHNAEHQEKLDAREDEKKDRWIRNILNGLGIAAPLGVTIWGTLKSLKFEETGTVTTQAGRGFIGRLFRGK